MNLSIKTIINGGSAVAIALIVIRSMNLLTTSDRPHLANPGTYRGHTWKNERTVSVTTLGETAFARCDVHTVVTEDGKNVIDDWIFLEEVSAVNIVVQTVAGKFVVFNQRKYAIPGDTLSPVGGFIDEGESPLTAARREVMEELGLGSRKTLETITNSINGETSSANNPGDTNNENIFTSAQVINAIKKTAKPPIVDHTTMLPDGQVHPAENDPDWVFLGRYRTAANRGGGWLYSYLLKNAVPLVAGGGTVQFVGSGDDEKQQISFLSEDEVMSLVSDGVFQEVKWAATFALSMLHLKDNMPGCCSGKN